MVRFCAGIFLETWRMDSGTMDNCGTKDFCTAITDPIQLRRILHSIMYNNPRRIELN